MTAGTAGQVLTKKSSANHDYSWADLPPGGSGSPSPESTISGRSAGAGTGPLENLTAAQIKTILGYTAAQIGAEAIGVASALLAIHQAAGDPHAQYLTGPEGNLLYDALGVAAAAVATHEAASNPHSVYLTQAEGDAIYAALAAPAAAVAAHEAASNPHPVYLTQAEGDTLYTPIEFSLDADLVALAAANNSGVLAATTASFLTADETKLDGIAAGATVGATWGSNVSGQPSVVAQAEAEVGTATTERIWTAQRVNQAIQALAPGGSAPALAHLVSSDKVLAAGTIQYFSQYMEIGAGFTYEVGADADLEIG